MKEILKVKDLSVNNNSVKILKNISFNIKKGEILGIVGESGCGKSTLIRALIQMMNKSEEIISGEILFNERNLLSLDNKQIRKLRGNNLAVIFAEICDNHLLQTKTVLRVWSCNPPYSIYIIAQTQENKRRLNLKKIKKILCIFTF